LKLSNSYSQLGEVFFQRVLPSPVANPKLLLWNADLANQLEISEALSSNTPLLTQYFSGNQLPQGADSIALAYSGHQFGHLNPQLGDGRAHLIGELVTQNKCRYDVQLKGSGPTPFSRQGDGRCALGPAIREYIMSEAMHALGVPTTRCLAVVATGETVYRETIKPGAIVTRIASSHLRIGTFQYFAIRRDLKSLQKLLDYGIERHFPEINTSAKNKVLLFLEAVMSRQINLIVHWMRVGFIHGVMNTDNIAICGETIDYGPCAMLGTYHPDTVFSSIDQAGRYAFGNQANITLWNLTRLAEALLPLIDEDENKAVTALEEQLNQFQPRYEEKYFQMLANKLGLSDIQKSDRKWLQQLLELMEKQKLDYTQTFYELGMSIDNPELAQSLDENLGVWYQQWKLKLNQEENDIEFAKELMKKNNPLAIPRNHHVEAILSSAEKEFQAIRVEDFLEVLRSPYKELPNTKHYQDLPADADRGYRTFCGT